MKYLRFAIFLLCISATAYAAVWIVPDSLSSIQAAVDTAVSGDTVLVMRSFQNSGTVTIADKQLAIIANNYMKNPDSYSFTTGVAVYNSTNTEPLFVVDHADSTIVKGILFDLAEDNNGGGIIIRHSQGVQFDGIHFKGNRLKLISSDLSMQNTVHYNIQNGDSSAISLVQSHLTTANAVWKSQQVPYLLSADNTSSLTTYNLAAFDNQCSVALMNFSQASAQYNFVTFFNNITLNPAFTATGSSVIISNSIFTNAIPADPDQFTIRYSAVKNGYAGIGNIVDDPLIDSTNAHPVLLPISPCISAADPDTSGIPLSDIVGSVRPNPEWAPPDMGAYESARHVRLNTNHHFWVDIDGDDVWGNGTQELPFASIQAAVDYAADEDTVVIQPGIYRGNIAVENKILTIGSTYIFDNDTSAIISTILLADTAGYSPVISVSNTDSLALRGVTLKHGRGRFFYNNYTFGGGLYCENSSCYIERVVFEDNHAEFGGGALYALLSTITLNHVTMQNNTAYMGGALFFASSTGKMAHTDIYQNTASSGGGIYAENNSKLILFYTDISDNIANTDSAISHMLKPGSISQYGGGIYTTNTDLQIHNVLLSGNHAENKGAAIASRGGKTTIIQSTLADNTAGSDSSGILYFDQHSDRSTVLNSIIWNPNQIQVELSDTEIDFAYTDLMSGIGSILKRDDLSDITAGNMLDNDPLFTITYALSDGSPCREFGTAKYVQGEYYLVHYNAADYDGTAPGLGHCGAHPPVVFDKELVLTARVFFPEYYDLLHVYPNPFNPETRLSFSLEKAGLTGLDIYNLKGQHVQTLLNTFMPAGSHVLTFYAAHLPAGLYICRLHRDGITLSTKKLMLIK
ncbi:MAG: T9SS type A sorting domain-containing protein [Candidatus Marinimicrobia bacterium]|nr:T9SS type A sorting domain-containing protein [Candidatus Neomarinimicrobiota bacterium]